MSSHLLILDDDSAVRDLLAHIGDSCGFSVEALDPMALDVEASDHNGIAGFVYGKLEELASSGKSVAIILDGTWSSAGAEAEKENDDEERDCVKLVCALNEIPDSPVRVRVAVVSGNPPARFSFTISWATPAPGAFFHKPFLPQDIRDWLASVAE